MMQGSRAFAADEAGTSAIEYGFIAALVSIAAIGAFSLVGDSLVQVFLDGVAGILTNAAAGS